MGTQLQILSPIIQYGFAGLSVVLLGIIVWLISRLLGILAETNTVIKANTAAIQTLDQRTGETLALTRRTFERLLCKAHNPRANEGGAGE